MMEYEVFKQVVEERIGEFLPPIFGACKVSVSTVRKVNQEKDALQVIPEHSEQITAIPNIYLDEMYETFKECQDLSEVMRMIAAMVIHYTGSFRPDKADLDFCSKRFHCYESDQYCAKQRTFGSGAS